MRTVQRGGGAVTETTWSGNPITGELSQGSVTTFVAVSGTTSDTTHYAIASLIVERDGSVRHVRVIEANSEESELATAPVLDRCVFQPGERDGQAVRTRVTLTIMVRD
jgi:hypothetical protein